MLALIRRDSMELKLGTKEEEFEKFLAKRLFPFFDQHYTGRVTRTASAALRVAEMDAIGAPVLRNFEL